MAAQRTATLPHPYGAYELRLLYNHHLLYGLHSSIGLILACIVAFFTFNQLRPAESQKTIIHIPIDVIPQTTLYATRAADVHTKHSSIPRIGIPVPIPDPLADPEKILMDQKTLSQTLNTSLEGLGDGSIIVQSQPDDQIETEPDMNVFHAIEIEPLVIHSVVPDYPEIARRSGIEGKVYVKALVDKTGRVRKTVVISTINDVFNQFALDAAGQYVFTPGMMNNGPVAVWVTLRFEFILR